MKMYENITTKNQKIGHRNMKMYENYHGLRDPVLRNPSGTLIREREIYISIHFFCI